MIPEVMQKSTSIEGQCRPFPVQTPDRLPQYRFPAQVNDAAGMDYMVARYYSSSLGRFMAVDPGDDTALEDPQSWNQYAYVRNSPPRFYDPDGQVAIVDDVAIGVALAVTATVAYLVSPSPSDPTMSNGQVLGESLADAIVAIGSMVTHFTKGGKQNVKDSEYEHETVETLKDLLDQAKKAGDTERVKRIIRTLKGKKGRDIRKRIGRGFDFILPSPLIERTRVDPRRGNGQSRTPNSAGPIPVIEKAIVTTRDCPTRPDGPPGCP
jgi:RHS repeat-associated protein